VEDGEPAASCQVSLLVPHPSRTAVLVEDSATTTSVAQLPTVSVPGASPTLTQILDLVDVVEPTTPVLRFVSTSAHDEDDEGASGDGAVSTLLLEFDSVPEPPDGWTWQDLEPEVIGRLEPKTSRSAEQMAADGRPAVEAPRQLQLWDLSVVLKAVAADGEVFFKCSADVFRHEAMLTQALAERMPGMVPDVIAIDRDQGWLLMRDLGAPELGEQDESLWHEGLVAHAGIQQSWLGRTDELIALGLPVRSLSALAADIEALSDDVVLLSNLSPDDRERWVSSAPAFVDACRRLDRIGPGPTLVHGDLHPWNVAFRPGRTRVFDWSDAAVSHPFVDLDTYVFRTKDVSVRRRLVDAYVDAWFTTVPQESLKEAVSLSLLVGALYQVQTYRALLPTLMASGRDGGLADGDLGWMRRALTIQHDGLEAGL
jgi:hypothetical protein